MFVGEKETKMEMIKEGVVGGRQQGGEVIFERVEPPPSLSENPQPLASLLKSSRRKWPTSMFHWKGVFLRRHESYVMSVSSGIFIIREHLLDWRLLTTGKYITNRNKKKWIEEETLLVKLVLFSTCDMIMAKWFWQRLSICSLWKRILLIWVFHPNPCSVAKPRTWPGRSMWVLVWAGMCRRG